jgi:ParB/RepB/Spo0J family partition protein
MSDEIISQTELVEVDLLKANEYNPNEMTADQFQVLVDDIKENGFVGPIIVNGKNEIINGFHRWKAAKFLGYSQIPVVRFNPVDDDHQKMLTIGWNEKHGDMNPTKLAQIILDLSQRHSLDEMASRLGYSEEQIKDKLAMSQVTPEFMEQIKKQAEERQKEIPTVMNFAVNDEERTVILKALESVGGRTNGEKLYNLCNEFLIQKEATENGKQ